jgi:predicted neuraminidase
MGQIKIADGIKIETLTKPVIGSLHHAHCSGVVAFDDGELLVVYYHAVTEANRKQAIYGVRKLPGKKWSEPFLVSKDKPNRMEGNPVIWIAPDTKILWLFYVTSPGGWSVVTPKYKISEDRGKTWSKSKKIYWFISRGTKNPPILTTKGWYVLPAYVEFRDYFGAFYVSKDQGKHWKQANLVKIPDEDVPNQKWGRLVLQPTVIERKDGSLIAVMRAAKQLGKMYKTESFDGGLTWTPASPYVLPNPGGGFHWMRLKSGNIAVIYNHAPAEPLNKCERNPVSIALSEDDGKTWAYRRNICEFLRDDPNNPNDPKEFKNSFGYPTMTQGQDGIIHVTNIQYTSFTEDWIKKKKFFDSAFE